MVALVRVPSAAFRGEIAAIDATTRARIEGKSWRGDDERCPPFDELAYLRMSHVTFDSSVGDGELIVNRRIAERTVRLFRRLYELGVPIRSMRLVDDFDASDDRSMSADNSSAFNFRVIAGTNLLSQHALGLAIDINPVENPWRRPDRIVPAEGIPFADRSNIRPGMFVRPGPIVSAFDELGWEWGGDWLHAFDDHHIVWSRRA